METKEISLTELLDKAQYHNIKELAEMFETDYSSIYRVLAKYQVRAKKAYSAIDRESLEMALEQDATVEGMAKTLQTTPSTVSRAMGYYGMVKPRKAHTKSKFVGERAFKVLGWIIKNPDENLASIGRHFNCTREYVRQIKQCAINEGIINNDTRTD